MSWAPVVVAGISTSRSDLNAVRIGRGVQIVTNIDPSPARVQNQEFSCWISGTALFGNRALLTGADLAEVFENAGGPREFISQWGGSAKNPCVSIISDPSAEVVYVLPDPLGGCLVFYYEHEELTFMSPDLESLVEVAGRYGQRPKKSLTYQLERTVLGTGGLTPASYIGVRTISVFEYAVVNRVGSKLRVLPAIEHYLRPAESYVGSLEEYKQDVLESVHAISSIEGLKTAHLTGGFDSRLVLSGIMDASLQDQFRYFCSGPVGTADRDTADGLATTLGLTRTHEPGLSTAVPESLEDRFLAPMLNSAGITASGPNGKETYSGSVLVGGGYGEILRSIYSQLAPSPLEPMTRGNLAEKLWGPPALALGGLVTSSSRGGILERLDGAFLSLRNDGYEDDYLADAFYLAYRNRYHIGQNSILWSRVGYRYDPLYSIRGPRLARMLPVRSRRTNVVGFDVMASMRADLLAYPFDNDRFAGEYSMLRRIPVVKDFVGTNPTFAPRSNVMPIKSAVEVDQELRKKHILQSRKMGVNFWQIESLLETQYGLKKLISNLDVSDFDDAINPEYVKSLAVNELRSRSEIRHLYAVYSMLLWYTKD